MNRLAPTNPTWAERRNAGQRVKCVEIQELEVEAANGVFTAEGGGGVSKSRTHVRGNESLPLQTRVLSSSHCSISVQRLGQENLLKPQPCHT